MIILWGVAAFGGIKESGIERRGSRHGIEEYTELKFILMADHRFGIVEIASDCSDHKVLISGPAEGPFHGTNDLCMAPDGGIYFTDQGASGLDAPYGRIFHLSAGGALSELMGGIPSLNGVVLTPDGASLLVAVTRANAIWRLPLTKTGEVRKAGVFIQFSGGIGPDGLAIADDGRIVVVHARLGVWLGQHPRHAEPRQNLPVQPMGLPPAQRRRALLQQLKHFRAVATRYDKRDDNFLASIQLASIRIWLRTYESVT